MMVESGNWGVGGASGAFSICLVQIAGTSGWSGARRQDPIASLLPVMLVGSPELSPTEIIPATL